MAQQTNLNVSPYFDDFDPKSGYHKVLFKPGYPVQARELSGMQSILQNQLEKFGQHFFKEGAKVIPGNTAYSPEYFAVELNNTHLGVPVDYYIEQLVGRKIIGLTTGVTAIINKVLEAEMSERGNLTIYVSYISAGVEDSSIKVFNDGELLTADSDITSGPENNAYIPSGESFASCIPNDATSTAASFSISNGVYFIRGNFVNVEDETIILSQYDNSPNGRIGLRIEEDIINADEDETLSDNSKGFNNYAAPGADRLKITCSLYSKPLDDFNDSNFIELAVIEDGTLQSQTTNTKYNYIADELARRTHAESGDYTVTPFDVIVKNSLNDHLGNNGVYDAGQFTSGGELASDDLAIYQFGPGKAFVKGYEIETISSTYMDVPKPRTTKRLEGQQVQYKTGSTLSVNNVKGLPTIGIGNTYIVSLRSERIGIGQSLSTASGQEIGVARVYDCALESGSYSTSNNNQNIWDISLYDVQLSSRITLNEIVSLSIPTYVKGKYSGATGFLKDAVTNSTSLDIYEKSGEFLANEPFEFNGTPNNRVAIAVTSYGMGDVKSIYGGPDLGNVGSASTFNSDTLQKPHFTIGGASITARAQATGKSVVTSENPLFPGDLKVNNILQFGGFGNNESSYARITDVTTTSVSITGVTTVTGVVEGEIPQVGATTLYVPNMQVISTPISESTETSLYTLMPKPFISDVDLEDAVLTIRKAYTVDVDGTNGQLTTLLVTDTNESFTPYDEERYAFTRSDGTTVALTDDMFLFTAGATQLQLKNLGSSDIGATLIATLKKSKPTAKIKRKNRVNSIIVNASKLTQSGIGATTKNDGLVPGNFPIGTRVQDEKIVLNYGDIVDILGIFESNDVGNATAPKMILSSLTGSSGKTEDLVVGEKIIGENSGAIAYYAEKITDAQITYLTQNETGFEEGEAVTFEESKVKGIVTTLDAPSRNIGANYSFDSGQKSTFYDYGFIQRRTNAKAPTKSLKIYFTNGYYEDNDEGDITTKNSYDTWDYSADIQTINGERNTDSIDIRPKVGTYTVVEGARSPLEFYGRSFTASGNSAANILASDESIITNFSFYLGRTDRVFLSKTGNFQIQYGDPAEKPVQPVGIDDALEIATISLPPYLFIMEDSTVDFLSHKRYRMRDIRDLENRIKNLEYYTSLSMLESETANLFVPDADGLNKFKSGFFVDNFTSIRAQEDDVKLRNSIDPQEQEMRPQHYTSSIDLMVGPVEGIDASTDTEFLVPEGTNIRKGAGVVTLDYTEKEWLSQQFATRTESVTPFLVSFWQLSVKLTPSSDTWTDTARIKAKITKTEGNFAGIMAQAQNQWGVDPQTGLSPILWNAWETNWTGQRHNDRHEQRDVRGKTKKKRVIIKRGWINGGRGRSRIRTDKITKVKTLQTTTRDTYDTGVSTRDGIKKIVTEQWDNESLGDKVVSRDIVTIMRSRNVEFRCTKTKPLTQLYAFFDNQAVTKYCTPKLLEITMNSGKFRVGETVIGTMPGSGVQPEGTDKAFIKFRVAQANHRTGPYNAPKEVYKKNPYQSQVGATGLETFLGTPGTVQLKSSGSADMPSTYSATSTILNIDTFSLSDQPQGGYFGYASTGMELRGNSSGAQAKVSNLRLVSDLSANLVGTYYIPNPNTGNHPKFETGVRTFTLIDNQNNDQNDTDTFGSDNYTASGTLETVQETIISTRNAVVTQKNHSATKSAERFSGSKVIAKDVVISTRDSVKEGKPRWYDPLAQSFQVTEDKGIFVTSCDIYFKTKDDMDIPMTFQLRTMKDGTPTQKVIPFSEIVKSPDQINLSSTGTVATTFEFEAPVYLAGANTEYAICLASWSTKYQVFISRIGESDLLTDEFISQQPYLGSLFKSQNASTWDASQWEDLKFKMRRAIFKTNGTMEVYNPVLSEGNAQIPVLQPNSINVQSRMIRIGIGSTLQDTDLTIGNTINQTGSNATGDYVGNAGIGTSAMGVINAGLGYTPSAGEYGFIGVGLTNVTSSGDYMYADVFVADGVAVAATITSSSSGFSAGDVLGIATIGNSNVGRNARLSVVSIGQTNELLLDNVQGNFVAGVGKTMSFVHPITGITTQLNSMTGGMVDPEKITVVQDGLHFTVDHKNHGMHHELNRVTLEEIGSDVPATKITLPYNTNSSSNISVETDGNFGLFENVSVATTNPGLARIGDEIVKYTGTSGNTLTGITRGSDKRNYIKGTPIVKYELGGVSLARFNKTHKLSDITDRDPDPLSFDHYTLKIEQGTLEGAVNATAVDRSSSTAGSNPVLYCNDTKSAGGYYTTASQNMPFQIINPTIQNVTVPGTTVSATMRTISAANMGECDGQGADLPFLDQGYEVVTLGASNYLTSARMIASRTNEINNDVFENFPGRRSFGMTIRLQSSDPSLSPVIDLQRMSAILVSNRVDEPVQDYITDNRVCTLEDDPTACMYISKENILESSATSIKVMMQAHINQDSDIRAFYAISDKSNFEPIFIPFPGYKNLNNAGEVIELDKSDGNPDKRVPLSDAGGFMSSELAFSDYDFTANNLPPFTSYRIKFVLTSTNQTYVPRVSNLRVITLA